MVPNTFDPKYQGNETNFSCAYPADMPRAAKGIERF